MSVDYQAVLLVSFGGPEGPDDVIPFLENVLRGRHVPRERMLEVAQHYHHFGGVSPINQQNRELIDALRNELAKHGPAVPIYWGNRNWHPMLKDTISQMAADGIEKAVALVTTAFSCYSGCRQYREDIARARDEVGPRAPQIDKLRVYFNHPGFVAAMTERLNDTLAKIPKDRLATTRIVFTAHSIPLSMAAGCEYEKQLREASRLVSQGADHSDWELVFQSRSGRPSQPWLEPDICDHVRGLDTKIISDLVVVPIGFVSDHMEVLFDLDNEAREVCNQLGLNMHRVATVGTHWRFVSGLRELIQERFDESAPVAVGEMAPAPHICPEDCCLAGTRKGQMSSN